MAKGNFIEYVVSDNLNKYPDGGEQGGYYWECIGGKPELIEFTISGTTYQAEKGMTWEEWIPSEYNTEGYQIVNNYVMNSSGSSYVEINGQNPTPTDIIVLDGSYRLGK